MCTLISLFAAACFFQSDLLLAQTKPATLARLASQSLLLDGDKAGSRLIVVGERGHILVSDDSGLNWEQVSSPVSVLLTAIHMHDAQLGFITGHDGVILRTQDGGESWELVHHAPEEQRPLLDIWFGDANRGFAVGAYGYFLETSDRGNSWVPRMISEDDYHFNSIAASESEHLFIGAEFGVAYHSRDAGVNWQEIDSPYTGSWFGALTVPPSTLFLGGLRGSLYRSTDNGATWDQIQTATTATLTDMTLTANGTILVSGLDGVLLTSRDGGNSFSMIQNTDRLGISAVVALADDAVLLVGEFGVRHIDRVE